MRMPRILAFLAVVITIPASTATLAEASPVQNPDVRAARLVARMTLDEKIQMVHGVQKDGYIGYVPPIPRLGIPALALTDGPAGVRQGQATQLPAPIGLAAGFDTGLATAYGDVLGTETALKGQNMMLGPNVNIARVPQNGRTFEAFGEDPHLAGAIAAPEIQGIQRQRVIGTVKHYAGNNQEIDRGTVNDVIDQRTLQEIYLPAFRAAVTEGGSGSVMCAYNKVNGPYSCENKPLLTDVLRTQFHFPGFVVSDWGGTHSTAASAKAGLDMEMPDDKYFGASLRAAVTSGEVPMAVLDTMVRRILRTMIALGLVDRPATPGPIPVDAHAAQARTLAENTAVLLKNDDRQLPLSANRTRSVAVIGADAATSATSGGGSARVIPAKTSTALQAIRDRVPGARVDFAAGTDPVNPASDLPGLPQVPSSTLTPSTGSGTGLSAAYYPNQNLTGPPSLTRTDPGVSADWNWYGLPAFAATSAPPSPPDGTGSARWSGSFTAPTDGTYTFDLTSENGSVLSWDGRVLIDNSGTHAVATKSATVQLRAGEAHTVGIEYRTSTPGRIKFGWKPPAGAVEPAIRQAAETARHAAVAVVVVRDYETENIDRPNLVLPNGQDRLIAAVAAANPHTVVVLQTGAPVLMPWLRQIPSVLETWYPGEEGGAALAALLFGDATPSGKLPITFPRDEAQVPAATPPQYPGVNGTAVYSEGLRVGYRHYDARGFDPLFPFGFGLSYTSFRLGRLDVDVQRGGQVTAAVAVTNTGDRAGAEVVQAYVGFPAVSGEPPRQLKAFTKVVLRPHETKVVHLRLDAKAFANWSTSTGSWRVNPGRYQVLVGSSSRDLPLRSDVTLPGRDLGA